MFDFNMLLLSSLVKLQVSGMLRLDREFALLFFCWSHKVLESIYTLNISGLLSHHIGIFHGTSFIS